MSDFSYLPSNFMRMRVIYRSQFQRICVDLEKKCMEQKWFSKTIQMKEEQYCAEQLVLVENILHFLPIHVLVDMQKLDFILSPELQAWTNEHVNIRTQNILGKDKKYAFVVSHDFITQISVEQTLDEMFDKKSEYVNMQNLRYFENKEEAKKWLLSKEI